MRLNFYRTALLALLILALLVACEEEDQPTQTPDTVAASTRPRDAGPTPTSTLTPPPTLTPLPTATPTNTPTPTATAPAMFSHGNPLALIEQDPSPQAGAPCGVIDRLDFPLDPPDALDIARGGQDFGRFRSRYDGYHAGEDWWGPGGRGGSFGEPVYSIGHGQVTFAHPYGWGIDQGTIILRHVYADGREFYSFYGHLDPPSVELDYGQCVTRGQKIAEIGRPRGSPHLHFEIRLHTPSDPGPGYWSHDPTRSGWLSPSQTIWNQRIAASPGVAWYRPYSNPGLQGIGLWQEDTLVAIANGDLLGLANDDGHVRWRMTLVEVEQAPGDDDDDDDRLPPLAGGVFDAREPVVYTANHSGYLSAIRLPEAGAGADESGSAPEPELLWNVQLHRVRGAPELIPLPQGGVVLTVQRRMIAFSSAGAILWREPFDAQLVDWLLLDQSVLVSASGDEPALWQLNAQGRQPWPVATSGMLAQSGGQIYLYDADAVYRLDAATGEASLFYDLPDGLASQSDILALPDGSLLLAHMATGDRLLLAIGEDGSLQWQRSYGRFLNARPELIRVDDEVYLLSEEGNGAWSRIFLHRVNLVNEDLTLLFTGGTRDAIPGGVWAFTGAQAPFLINIGGGSLVALDAAAALQNIR